VVDEVEQAAVGPVQVLEDQPPVPRAAMRSKNVRQAAKSCRAAGARLADAEQGQQRRLDPARSASSGRTRLDRLATFSRVVGSSSPRASRRARRTISPSAQKVMPSP
jgi:hypothetical protein